jgi:ATP-dependent helicase HepA
VLRDLLKVCEQQAAIRAPALIATASGQGRQALRVEIDRLRALSRINPSVRHEEIAFFEQQLQLLENVLQAISPRLDALRVLVAT